MPRVTRAALRLNAMLEETNLVASTTLPLNPLPQRAPLGEITGNSEEVKTMINDLEQLVKEHKKAPLKERRGKVQKEAKKFAPNARSEESVEVIEDDNQSATSSAVDEACQELMRETSGEIHQVVMHDQRPHTPPSPAVAVVKKHLSSKVKASKASAKVQTSASMVLSSPEKNKDAPPNLANAATLALLTCMDGTDKVQSCEEAGSGLIEQDDLILEKIMSRSPAQPISRIEDSVEAIDAFEEAIEKVGELIPAITEGPRSPSKVVKAGDFLEPNDKNNASTSNPTRPSNAARSLNVKSKRMTTRATTAFQRRASHLSPQLTSKPVRVSDRGLAPMVTSVVKSRSTSSTADATIRRANPKRVSSIHKAPFQPTKSTKPPTRASFELPGEAVARKLKEQREERMKRGEEEPAKKPVLKARPSRLSQAPVVRQTTSSSARLSLAKPDLTKKPLSGPVSTSNADANKRLSTISVAKRSSLRPATTTTHPLRTRSLTVVAKPRVISATGPSQAPIAAPDAAQLKLRGKEVFNRNRVELDERDRARKEKEEAARKARADAAERGRIASREWAEKQRVKKLSIEKENQGDRALMGH